MQTAVAYGVGISAGTLRADTGTVVLSNSNGVSFGAFTTNNSEWKLTASGATVAGVAAAILSLSAGTAQVTSGQAVLANSGISFGANAQTITAAFSKISLWDNGVAKLGTQGGAQLETARPYFHRVNFFHPMDATRADLLAFLSQQGASGGTGTYSYTLGLYALTGSTANLLSSSSISVSWTSGTNSTAASVYGGQSGIRWRTMALGTWAITPGEYLLGGMFNATPGNFTDGEQVRVTFWGSSSGNFITIQGDTVTWFQLGELTGNVTTAAMPATVALTALTDIQGSTAFVRLLGTF